MESKTIAPGPPGHPILGALPAFRTDPIQAFMDGWHEYGDVVTFRGKGPMFLIANPDHLKQVLQDRHSNYPHPTDFNHKFSAALGQGLVTIEGDQWLRHRRMIQPAFHRQKVSAFADVMVRSTQEMMERWQGAAERRELIDIRLEMMQLTLDVLAKCMFSVNLGRDIEAMGPAVAVQFEHVNRRLLSVIDLPLAVPTTENRRFLEARRTMDEIVYRLIGERRRSKESTGDLLSMLIEVRDEETGEGLTDLEIRDELMTIIFAGHETVSTALTWAWYLLSKNPDVERSLHAEVDEVLGERTATFEDVPNLRYTTMLLEETMRLYPPLWLVTRMAREDDEIGGFHIPARSTIILSAYVTHRHTRYWENPEGCDPERFTPERSANRHRFAYYPFIHGPRRCVGSAFGMMEMQLVIATVAQQLRLELEPGYQTAFKADISLRPRDGMPMLPRRRSVRESAQAPASRAEGEAGTQDRS